jgi:large subunit ribosomal protein L4
MPRKMRRLALACALSVKAAGDAVALVENMRLDVPQTKAIRALIAAAAPGQKTLFVLAGPNQNVERSIRNLEGARYCGPDQLNIRDVLRHDKVLIDTEALDGLAARLDRGKKESADA